MDKIDGPYYFFGVLAKLRRLPSFTPMVLPDTGRTNIIPVDHVADALVVLMHADATVRPSLSPRRKPSDFGASTAASRERPGCRSCAAPCRGPLGAVPEGHRARQSVPRHGGHTVGRSGRDPRCGGPDPTFTAENTAEALRRTGLVVPDFADYAPMLWKYWAEHLDPDRPGATIRPVRWPAGT